MGRGGWVTASVCCAFVFCARGAARATEAPVEPDFGQGFENVREVAHEARVTLFQPGVARVTVTRTFEAREPSHPVGFWRGFDLPGDAVVTSFEIRTDGAWRKGRLRRDRPKASDRGDAAPRLARDGRPWAAFEWLTGSQAQLQTPLFRAPSRFAIRYTLLSRGKSTPRGHQWLFCPDRGDDAMPEITGAPSSVPATFEVRPSEQNPGCRTLETTESTPTTLAPRYASYRLGPRAWFWRIELRSPASLLPVPPPPAPGPVVFVLDASRSQEPNGGLATQLAIVRAYLANAPQAEVELVLVSRTAERVFGKLVPAADLERALPKELLTRPLGNGSFLERGAALAAEILAGTKRAGRIVLMTDAELRSAFDRAGVIASLRGAPAGTVVHLVFPGRWASTMVTPWVPDGLTELPATFGGAGYQISVAKEARPGDQALATLARRLVWPDRVESTELHDVGRRDRPEWPSSDSSPFRSETEVEAGEEHVWSGVSPTPPPGRLALTGQIWSRRLDFRLRPDAALARELPRLATADDEAMGCSPLAEHRGVALARGFLAPELVLWVPGTGDGDSMGGSGLDPECSGGFSLSGRGSAAPLPARDELPRALVEAVLSCGLVVRPKGDIIAKVETQRSEILDVVIAGADDRRRRCAEEAVWNGRLPDKFNPRRWQREAYSIGLAPAPAQP